MLAVLAAPSLFAQQRAYVPSEGVAYEGPVAERGGDVLRHYDPDTDVQTITRVSEEGGGGFVFGTNGYTDLGKAVVFSPPGEITIQQVDVWLHRSELPELASYDLVFYEGDAASGPLLELYRETYDVFDVEYVTGDLETGIGPTSHALETPLTVSGDFVVAVEWAAGYAVEDFGIVNTQQLAEASPYEWELWGDGSGWHEVNGAWGVSWHLWMDVLYTGGTTAGEAGAQPQAATLAPIYPNPFADRASVSVELDAAQRVSVEVFNVLGQRVATLFSGTLQGARTFVLDGATLDNGLYVVRLQGEDFVQSRKVVLSR